MSCLPSLVLTLSSTRCEGGTLSHGTFDALKMVHAVLEHRTTAPQVSCSASARACLRLWGPVGRADPAC